MEFIEKYARVDDTDDNGDIADDDEIRRQSDDDFIDDDETSFQDQNSSDYRLQNVTRDLQEAMQDKSMWQEFGCSDPENFVPGCFDDVEYEFDTFDDFEKRIEKFKSKLKLFKEGTKESFYFAALYGAFFKLDETKDTFVEDREVLESVLGKDFLSCLERKREGLYLDLNLNTFERQCQEINDLLLEKKLFLRVLELKKKCRYLIKKGPQKNNVQRDLSNCVEERLK